MGNMIWTPLDAPWYLIFSPKCLDAKLPFFAASIPIVWWFNPEISWILRVKPSNHHLLTSSHAERQGPKRFPLVQSMFFSSSRNSKNSRPIFPTSVFLNQKNRPTYVFPTRIQKNPSVFHPPHGCSPAAVHVRLRGEVIVSQSEQLLRRVEDLTAEEQLAAEDRRWGSLRGWWLDNSGFLLIVDNRIIIHYNIILSNNMINSG